MRIECFPADLFPLVQCLTLACTGRATVLGGHADSERIIYANGKSIVIRSLKNLLETDTYIDHQYATTVAKFSPNGSWVASGDAVREALS